MRSPPAADGTLLYQRSLAIVTRASRIEGFADNLRVDPDVLCQELRRSEARDR